MDEIIIYKRKDGRFVPIWKQYTGSGIQYYSHTTAEPSITGGSSISAVAELSTSYSTRSGAKRAAKKIME